MALLITGFSGLFFLVGVIIYYFVKHKSILNNGAFACACVVILGLIFGDLLPELKEIGKWWIGIIVIIGLILLIVIDKFVPHHEHHHMENDDEGLDHQNHLKHVSCITIVVLIIHNVIEGMALYSVSINDLKSGVLMLLGIGLHNLPFGFQVASFNKDKIGKLLIFLLVISGFIGGLIFNFFGSLNTTIEGIIIALTLGMLLHILAFELLPEVKENIKKKETIYGIIIGVILLVLINII